MRILRVRRGFQADHDGRHASPGWINPMTIIGFSREMTTRVDDLHGGPVP